MDLHDKRSGSKIAVCVHPPERRRRAPGIAACGCCCLHSVGGLIGAACAGVPRTPEERWATGAYWSCLVAIAGLSYLWLFRERGDELLIDLFLALPGLQIAASVVAGVIVLIFAGPKALPRLWRITWRSFLGTAIGFVLVLMFFGRVPW